jgi:acetylornithine deacetylase/succinyl-diaminopimelate desuccinylase-like protein
VVIAAVMGEIIGGLGMRHLLEQERDFDMALVAEPTNLNLATISVGTVQGWIRLWGDTLYFNPHPNPIYAMAKVLAALGSAYEPLTPAGWMTCQPCPDLPGFPRFNARKIASGQDYCEIFFDARIVPGQNDETLRADLTRLLHQLEPELPGIRAEVIIPARPGGVNFPPAAAMSSQHPLAQAIIRHHTHWRGQPPVIGAGDRMGLASDASHLRAAGIYTLEYGPGQHPRWPMWDERIAVEDLHTAAQVFTATLAELNG